MNWNRLIRLMLPIRLRRGKRLLRLICGLAGQTMTDADMAERYKEREKAEARRIGQAMVVEELLRERFGPGTTITGQENGLVQLFGHEEADNDYRKQCGDGLEGAVLITDVEGTDAGCDFRVTVPEGVDRKEVERTLRGIVMAGVGYRVGGEND